jgi:hypothetical protein
MRIGDLLIPKLTIVASCGDIIFMEGRTYYIKAIDVSPIDVFWVDAEVGDWVLFEQDIASKFVHISLRSKRINDILDE